MKKVTKMATGMICKIDGYQAQTAKRWDKTPTALVLRSSKSRYLCFNINWLDKIGKKKLLKLLNKFLKDQETLLLDSNIKRNKFFNRLRAKNFPRSCYRVYLKSGLPKNIYQLNIEEFKQAINGDELTLVELDRNAKIARAARTKRIKYK